MATQQTLSTRQAAEHVPRGCRKPMTVSQIAEAALPLTNLKGATPKQTFYSVIYGEAKKPDGLFVRVNRGTFKLRAKPRKARAARKAAA
jgi:hypothetical protein